ncbi:MAG: GTP-binding protein [Verrucomicrobiota bacterium]|nr:GTP-binding protein [Verrucomicrobiota bacterium]|tara:strand:+ start:2309 stop:3586 length:1278 start_codon:yes stop_codon:yes gene_type:complete
MTQDTKNYLNMDLLRFSTAGSVDDGKSTLIGRLFHDTKAIFEDQLEAIEKTSKQRGDENLNLALLTDGLRAEREQGITIDVAYRYFATPRRKFIIADTPGHIQYTRNMVTGASTANLALILVDARHGVVEQTRRHAFIADLLGIKHVAVCINKMDLVGYEEEAYGKVLQQFMEFSSRLENLTELTFIPISALKGDNVVDRSENMDWYKGPPLLYHLENVYVGSDANHIDARFPVQWVIRPHSDKHHDFRGFAGRVAGGVFKTGDDVVVLPSGFSTKIKKILLADQELQEAFYPQSVTILLEDEIDVSRGDMLVKPNNQPTSSQDLEAQICWFSSSKKLKKGVKCLFRQTTKEVQAIVSEVRYKIDVNTLRKNEEELEFGMNDIGRICLRVSSPIFYDSYRRNRNTGSFILVDPFSNETLAAGMMR